MCGIRPEKSGLHYMERGVRPIREPRLGNGPSQAPSTAAFVRRDIPSQFKRSTFHPMKINRFFSIALALLAVAGTSLQIKAESAPAEEGWRTYRQSFLPALEVTADGDLREITDSARIRKLIARDAPVTRISRADREAFRHRVLGEFDLNDDGTLDEKERASAHAAMAAGKLRLPEPSSAPASVTPTPPVES